ncbi:MAG: hypothetical protein F6K47_19780 [Symploca sp. SIO2E6]|nr:hypothetical protein [Symploca sp. SIO2E6]
MIKKHYRKNTKGREEFEKLIDDYLEKLESNPCSDELSEPEPFPGNTAEQDFEFRKKRWRRLPKLQGGARLGRLIFVVYHPKRIVNLIWLYTHAEFQEPKSRPLRKRI